MRRSSAGIGRRREGIGRAAGRGKGEISGGAGSLKKKKKGGICWGSIKQIDIHYVQSFYVSDHETVCRVVFIMFWSTACMLINYVSVTCVVIYADVD